MYPWKQKFTKRNICENVYKILQPTVSPTSRLACNWLLIPIVGSENNGSTADIMICTKHISEEYEQPNAP